MKRTPASGWLAGGSVLAAIFASACCWLPLLAVLAGAAATGVAAVLWTARPWLLAGSAALLGAGFWMSYRRLPECEPGSECAAPVRSARRFHRTMLWIAAAGLVVATLFPNVLGLLPREESFAFASSTQIQLPVEGMTCAGCERAVERALQAVDGVVAVSASAADARVVVTTAGSSRPPHAEFVAAVAAAGYRVPDEPGLGGHWEGTLGEEEATLVADLGTTESGRWIGEVDSPSQGLENISLQVGSEGRAVRLVVSLPDEVVFAGELSADGDSIVGRFSQGDADLPFVLVRSGEVALSKELLAMEAGGDDGHVTALADDWRELTQAFNDGAGRTRLLMLLSPT
ncbi:MAG: mercuric transporter MerT family protein [bacterium]